MEKLRTCTPYGGWQQHRIRQHGKKIAAEIHV